MSSTGLGSSRRRERVLLGLDQAFASSTTSTSSTSGNAAATGRAGAGASKPAGGDMSPSNDAPLYTELPAQILTATTIAEGVNDKSSTTTVESALQALLLRNTKDLQLRGKTVTLDNTRSQNEQQRKEARQRRQLLRGRTRISISIAEEGAGGGGAAAAAAKAAAGGVQKKRKRQRQMASYQVYVGLEGAWQGYMQQLLGVRVEEEEEKEGKEEGEEDNDDAEPSTKAPRSSKSSSSTTSSRRSSTPTSLTAKKGAGRTVAGADLHGCRLRVVASKCQSEVGMEGLVLRESRGAFHLLPTTADAAAQEQQRRWVRIVPKAGRRFEAEVRGGGGGGRAARGGMTLVLHGNGLVDRGWAITSPLLMMRGKGGGGEGGRLLKTTHLV